MAVADVNIGFKKGKLYFSKAEHALIMVLQTETEGKRSNLIVTLDEIAQDKLKKVL